MFLPVSEEAHHVSFLKLVISMSMSTTSSSKSIGLMLDESTQSLIFAKNCLKDSHPQFANEEFEVN